MTQPSKMKAGRPSQRKCITRTACENCRDKRAKCDGKATCSRCASRRLTCNYAPRTWESKRELRETADHYCEELRRRERVLDAVSVPIVGDSVVQHLRKHGTDDTYDKLEELTGRAWNDVASVGSSPLGTSGVSGEQQDFASFMDDSSHASQSDNSSHTRWSASPATQVSSQLSSENSQFSLDMMDMSLGTQAPVGSNSVSTMPRFISSAQSGIGPSYDPVFPAGIGIGSFSAACPCSQTMALGPSDYATSSNVMDAYSWSPTEAQDSTGLGMVNKMPVNMGGQGTGYYGSA